jgi:hypothetical protein
MNVWSAPSASGFDDPALISQPQRIQPRSDAPGQDGDPRSPVLIITAAITIDASGDGGSRRLDRAHIRPRQTDLPLPGADLGGVGEGIGGIGVMGASDASTACPFPPRPS